MTCFSYHINEYKKTSECGNNNHMEINRHTTYTEEKIQSIWTSIGHLNI